MAHMSKQELKHDEMADLGEKVNDWYERHSTLITVLVVLAATIFIGSKGYDYWKSSRDAQATSELRGVFQDLQSAVNEQDETKRKEMFGKAVSEAGRVSKEHESDVVGRAAQMALGNAHYYQAAAMATKSADFEKELKSARDAFEKYITMAQTPLERAAGKLALGNVLENQLLVTKDTAKIGTEARKAYSDAAEAAPGSYIAAEARMANARLAANQAGQQETARRLFEQVASDRRLPEVDPKNQAKGFKDSRGNEVTAEEAERMRRFEDLSIAAEAEKSMRILRSLPGIPQQ